MTPVPTVDLEYQTPPGSRLGDHPRLSLAALWALYVLTLRQHLHGKRWMVITVLFVLPAVLAMVVRATAPDAPPMGLEFVFAFMFLPQALLPLVALIYASGMIQDEQEEQTLTYLLIRPIPKWALYVVKLLATLTTTIALTCLFTALTYIAVYAGNHAQGPGILTRCLKAMLIHSFAVTAYCCLFGFMSLFTRRALILGILYAVIFEGVLANLPISIRLVTIIYYTRIIAYRSMGFMVDLPGIPGRTENIAAEAWQLDIDRDPLLLEHPQISTCIMVLLIAGLIFTLLAAYLCSRREFHVKTPEKS